MSKEPPRDDFVDAVLGGHVGQTIAVQKQRAAADLGPAIRKYETDRAHLARSSLESSPDVANIASRAEAEFDRVTSVASADFEVGRAQVKKTSAEPRAFQVQHGLTRQPIQPDILLSLALLVSMGVVEAGVGTGFFYTSGYAPSIASSMAIAVPLAGVTSLLCVLGGGFFGRYWNYGLDARFPDQTMRNKRRLGRVCSLLTGTAIASVIGLGALVRTTGEPQNLTFSLEVLSNAATDMYSIMLFLASTGFAVLAWRTALSAFDDPYPGYAQACGAVGKSQDSLNATIANAYHELDRALDVFQTQLSEKAADFDDANADAASAFEALCDGYQYLSGEIDRAETDIRGIAARFLQNRQLIHEDDAPDIALVVDLDFLRKRLIPPVRPEPADERAFAAAHKDAVNWVSEAYGRALKALSNAQSDVRAQPSSAPTPSS